MWPSFLKVYKLRINWRVPRFPEISRNLSPVRMGVYTYTLFDPLEEKHSVPFNQRLIIKLFRRACEVLGTMGGK